MLDIKWIRENPKLLDEALQKRGAEPYAEVLLALDADRRDHIAKVQKAQEERNKIAKAIGDRLAKDKSADISKLKEQANALKEFLMQAEILEKELEAKLSEELALLPNIPCSDVPIGKDETDNQPVRHIGEIKKFPFPAKQHYELGEELGLMDFETASAMAGARFVILKGALARLERAIAQFMIDTHTQEHGYSEMSVPLLVRDEAMFGTAQLPKFAEDLFKTHDNRWLIPTAEVPLTNYVRESIIDHKDLPMRFTALTPCFRSEAGAAGRDTRGMLRQHQFWKVELVSIVKPEEGEAELERMTSCAEKILQKLELPFRTVILCSGDMGFAARKTYDIEVWLPGQNKYREISSCSLCGDFQARRMNARYRDANNDVGYLYSLNGSGTAVGRCLIAILENYQQQDGSIGIPQALQPYMNGQKTIQKAS